MGSCDPEPIEDCTKSTKAVHGLSFPIEDQSPEWTTDFQIAEIDDGNTVSLIVSYTGVFVGYVCIGKPVNFSSEIRFTSDIDRYNYSNPEHFTITPGSGDCQGGDYLVNYSSKYYWFKQTILETRLVVPSTQYTMRTHSCDSGSDKNTFHAKVEFNLLLRSEDYLLFNGPRDVINSLIRAITVNVEYTT